MHGLGRLAESLSLNFVFFYTSQGGTWGLYRYKTDDKLRRRLHRGFDFWWRTLPIYFKYRKTEFEVRNKSEGAVWLWLRTRISNILQRKKTRLSMSCTIFMPESV